MEDVDFSKQNVLTVLGSPKKAAKFFGTTVQAIYQWPKHKPIPEKRQLQLIRGMPSIFSAFPMITKPPPRAASN